MLLTNYEEVCLNSENSLTLTITTAVISLTLSLTSIVGNVLIILAVVLDPNKNLRRPFSWLIVNLAAADLLFGALADPFTAIYHFKLYLGKKPRNEELILLNTSFFSSSTASALTIASLAFERYLSVRKPNEYRNRVTNKRIIFTIVAIWLISFASLIMYLKLGYVLSSFINVNASFLLAASLSCFMYFLMWRKLKERTQVNHDRRKTSHAVPSDLISSNPVIVSRNKMEEKVTRMFLVVLVVMLCCFGSSALFTYFLAFCESCSCVTLHWFLDFGFILVSINSSLNFFCYAMQSSRFRSAFIKILKRKKTSHHQYPYSFYNVANNREEPFFVRAVKQSENIQMSSVSVIKANSAADQ